MLTRGMLLATLLLLPAHARVLEVPGTCSSLEAALSQARPGDRIEVRGTHRGHWTVRTPNLALVGRDGAVLDGGGSGTVLTVEAPGAEVTGFVIRGSGLEPQTDDSGLTLNAGRAWVHHNRFEEGLFGVFVARADCSRLEDNRFLGHPRLGLGRKGDAIRVWYSQDVELRRNRVERCRDLVAWYSSGIVVEHNTVEGGRYGIHFMYCDGAKVRANELRDNSVGIYTMYSSGLVIEGNLVAGHRGASGYGLGFKDANRIEARDNRLIGNRAGVMLDSTPLEPGSPVVFRDNLVAFNDQGLALMPSVRGLTVTRNTFWENREQVSVQGGGQLGVSSWQGNYWSDYAGCDLDGDGSGDLPYRSQRLFERLTDREPLLRYFADTPLQGALDTAARMFPVVQPVPKMEDPQPCVEPLHRGQPTAAGEWWRLAWVPLLGALTWPRRRTWRYA